MSDRADRAAGALLGMAAGDALGAGYEFGPPLPADADVQMIGGQILILEQVFFDTDRDTIKPRSFHILQAVADVLAAQTLFDVPPPATTRPDGWPPTRYEAKALAEDLRAKVIGEGANLGITQALAIPKLTDGIHVCKCLDNLILVMVECIVIWNIESVKCGL